MMSNHDTLASSVYVSRRFQRSTKLDSDIGETGSLDGFILQRSCEDCLQLMARYFTETSQRAFTWTGSYGSGKSTLALFLCSLLDAGTYLHEVAVGILDAEPERTNLIRKAFVPASPYRLITMTGHNGNLDEDFRNVVSPDSATARDAISAIVKEARSLAQGGIIIVIDELGKYLEGGNSNNCYFLQELAESVNRSNAPIIVLGILHQAFDAYAQKLTKAQRDEWAKVQGRYVDIPLLSGADEVLRLLDKSICVTDDFVVPDFSNASDLIIKELSKKRSLDIESFEETFRGSYPLNPVTACLLGTITRESFLQNTRSVFNFLTSQEPYGFNEFLKLTPAAESSRLYGPEHLWDYLQVNFEHAIRATATKSHRWAIAADCIERAERLDDPVLMRIVKTVAVLDLFRKGSGLDASEAVIRASLWPLAASEIAESLVRLVNEKIVVFRKFANAYSLFEGSDFDLDKAVDEALKQVDEVDIDALRRLLSLTPIIARRHYAQTGTMRWFSRELCLWSNLPSYLKQKPVDPRAAGRLILAFTSDEIRSEDFNAAIANLKPSVFIGVVNANSKISTFARELIALEQIGRNPAIEGDAVARQELTLRRDAVRNTLNAELEHIYEQITWHSSSSIGMRRIDSVSALNSLLSEACNLIYNASPRINNELINREQLSSNITHATKVLVNAMVHHEGEPRLGMTEFPPEVMIYLSLLKENGIHRCTDAGNNVWSFVTDENAPAGTPGASFSRIWSETRKFFETHDKPSLPDLYAFWSSTPFGLKAGVRPILAMAYFLANRNSLSIYLNEAFEPDVSDEILLTWFNDPVSIKFRYVPASIERTHLLEKLHDALKPMAPSLNECSPLSIARAIVRIVLTCPKWALNTSQLTDETKRFRNTVIKAWDPLALIFQQLPKVFGTDSSDEIVAKTRAALEEIRQVTPQMLERVRDFLLKALDAESIESLNARAKAIHGTAGQNKFENFIGKLSVFRADDPSIEGIISLAVTKPKPQWTDQDIDACLLQLNDWALSFRQLESMGALRNRPVNRRMISIVVGGTSGTSNLKIDLPAESTPIVSQASDLLKRQLAKFPKEVAIAALIELSMNYMKKGE